MLRQSIGRDPTGTILRFYVLKHQNIPSGKALSTLVSLSKAAWLVIYQFDTSFELLLLILKLFINGVE